MAKISDIERKDISKQAQKILKTVKPNSSTDDKAKAALALSLLSLLPSEQDSTIAQQFLKFLKDLQR